MNLKPFFNMVVTFCMVAVVSIEAVNAQVEGVESTYNVKELVSLEGSPDWFTKPLQREKKVKTKSKLNINQFKVNAEIIGDIKLIDEGEGTWYYHIDIGTDAPLECFVFTEFDGPANSLYGVVNNGLRSVEGLNKKTLTGKDTFAIGNGVIGSTPYLLFDTLYHLGDGSEKVSGVLKAMSAKTNNSLQVCMHNELGYRETFFSVFESLIHAFTESEENLAFFEIVTQLTSSYGLPLGYFRERYTLDSGGNIKMNYESSRMIPFEGRLKAIPDDDSSVLRTDSGFIGLSALDGALINKTEYSIQNNILSSNLSIHLQGDKWQVEGKRDGKDVRYDLDHDGLLLSDYGTYLGVAGLAKSDQASASYSKWLPNSDPTLVSPTVISKINNNSDANFKLNMGPVVFEFMAESNGVYNDGTLTQGPLKLNLKRIFSKGQPILK